MKLGKYLLCGLVLFGLTSCGVDLYHDSLENYINLIKSNDIGYSEYELDTPECFLPSKAFITDFNYLDGGYRMFEKDPVVSSFSSNKTPNIVILWLTYENTTYQEAKLFADSHLDLSSTNTFQYNNYYFAENMAHPKHYGAGQYTHLDENGNNTFFPIWFTMYCYNDIKNTLIFMGFYCPLEDGEKEKVTSDWGYFLNTYYGEYYDFNS
ncbi:MAG: hypothetical protein J1F32_00600 [Erysipelotrichales bacterium]|nr:hypothetical protein [Erysipelotrichales bacterium]